MTPAERIHEIAVLRQNAIDYWYRVDHAGGVGVSEMFVADGVFHAGPGDPLVGREAIEAFYAWRKDRGARTSRHIVTNFHAAFDGPRKDLHRTAIYPEYKSTRQKMPAEMAAQLDDIRAVVDAYGITVIEAERDEADDVIGTLAVAGRDAGMEVFVVTGDKDFLQLVDDRIRLWNLRSSTTRPEILGPQEAEAKRARVKLQTLGRPAHTKGFAELPQGLRDLIDASFQLHDRIVQLDRAMIPTGEALDAAPVNPVASQINTLEQAFGSGIRRAAS